MHALWFSYASGHVTDEAGISHVISLHEARSHWRRRETRCRPI